MDTEARRGLGYAGVPGGTSSKNRPTGNEGRRLKPKRCYWSSATSLYFATFFATKGVTAVIKRTAARPSVTAEIGRVKKVRKLPSETRSACLRLRSSMGPNTKASTRGAPSYSNFLNRYP